MVASIRLAPIPLLVSLVLGCGGGGAEPGPDLRPIFAATATPAPLAEPGPLHEARESHTATMLADGKVLIAGGFDADLRALASAEVYDPATGDWAGTGAMAEGRAQHTAALLQDGRVLVIGGLGPGYALLNSAETYDPATGTWSQHSGMTTRRRGHTSVGLRDGSVLTMGGVGELVQLEIDRDRMNEPFEATLGRELSIDTGSDIPVSVVMYDPSTDSLSDAGALLEGRSEHTATLLSDGRVVVMGGFGPRHNAASVEMYDPATQSWARAGPQFSPLTVAHSATRLAD